VDHLANQHRAHLFFLDPIPIVSLHSGADCNKNSLAGESACPTLK
jgi:hypothetical protein